MSAPRPIRRSRRAHDLTRPLLAAAALLTVSGCLTSLPARLRPGSDLARPEPSFAGTVRSVLQRCGNLTAAGASGDARDPDRCGRAARDTVRATPDTVERVHRVP